MTHNVARRAYSAEQLLALRHSASDESAIQVEAKAEEGAIKDHVVRNTRSFTARPSRSFPSSDNLHPSSADARQLPGPVLSEIDPNNQNLRPGLAVNRHRPSPSPSLKKRKAEQILQSHGSPPGLRVTAGGRIVPSDQSPLCSPRYGYSAIKKNGMLIKFGPNFPFPSSAMAIQKLGLPNGCIAQDPSGQLCQVVDGKFLPVNEINGIPQLYVAAPNMAGFDSEKMDDASASTPFDEAVRQQTSQGRNGSTATGPTSKPPTMKQPSISVSAQLQALEKQYTKLEQESRELDKIEVLQKSTMGTKAFNQLIRNRRDLVTRMNEIRVSIRSLKDKKASAEPSPDQVPQHPMYPQFSMPTYPGQPMMQPAPHMPDWALDGIAPEAHGMVPYGAPMGPSGFFMPPGAVHGPMVPYPHMMGPVPPMYSLMGIPPMDAVGGFMPGPPNMNPPVFSNGSPPAPRSDAVPAPEAAPASRRAAKDSASSEKESPRRSHALEIKHPENTESNHKSALNPMSPSYQPPSINMKASTPTSKATPAFGASPSPALAEAVRAHNAWIRESANDLASAGSQRRPRYESSESSYATADFFPNNPRDHSMRKDTYPVSDNRPTDRDRTKDERSSAHPITPDNEVHGPDWDPTPSAIGFDTVHLPLTQEKSQTAAAAESGNNTKQPKADPVGHRSEMNVSPKNRRVDHLLSFRSVSEIAEHGSVSASPVAGRDQIPSVGPSGFGNESTAYLEGFKAGEARSVISPDKTGLWLDGYCAGLKKSGQAVDTNAQPARPSARQAVPVHAASSVLDDKVRQNVPSGSRRATPTTQTNTAGVDKLKAAIISAQNENAILSPDPNGPDVNDMSGPDLGSWTKSHGAAPSAEPDAVLASMRNGEVMFPERTSSMVGRQLSDTIDTTGETQVTMAAPLKVVAGPVEGEQGQMMQERRAMSAQMQPARNTSSTYFQGGYPGHRVVSSQLEWKSGSSIAQVANLASGYFAQYDGTRSGNNVRRERQPLTHVSGNAGMPMHDAAGRTTSQKSTNASPGGQTRFIEGPMVEARHSPQSSPGKRSPAKVKFAQMAGKAGIKVRSDSKEDNEGDMSAHEKRRWRDVWKKRSGEGERSGQEQGGRQ